MQDVHILKLERIKFIETIKLYFFEVALNSRKIMLFQTSLKKR